jgi:phage RecT family recombinase
MTSSTETLKAAATGQQPPARSVAKKEPPKDFPAMLTTWKGEIANALPKHLNADRMARIALTCFRNTPKLGDCNPHRVRGRAPGGAARHRAGPDGRGVPDPVQGRQCQLIPGYMGLIKLAKQTGQVVDIYAMAVREKDKFTCTFGLNRDLVHEPKASKGGFPASQAERGEIIGVYAVAVFKDGTRTFVVMGKDEIDRIRDGSQGYKTAKKYGKKDTPVDHALRGDGAQDGDPPAVQDAAEVARAGAALALEDAHNAGKAQNIDMKDALTATTRRRPARSRTPRSSTPDGRGEAESGSRWRATAAQAGTAARCRAQGRPEEKGRPAPVGHEGRDQAWSEHGKYSEARDLVRAAPYTDDDRAEVESCHQAKHGKRRGGLMLLRQPFAPEGDVRRGRRHRGRLGLPPSMMQAERTRLLGGYRSRGQGGKLRRASRGSPKVAWDKPRRRTRERRSASAAPCFSARAKASPSAACSTPSSAAPSHFQRCEGIQVWKLRKASSSSPTARARTTRGERSTAARDPRVDLIAMVQDDELQVHAGRRRQGG